MNRGKLASRQIRCLLRFEWQVVVAVGSHRIHNSKLKIQNSKLVTRQISKWVDKQAVGRCKHSPPFYASRTTYHAPHIISLISTSLLLLSRLTSEKCLKHVLQINGAAGEELHRLGNSGFPVAWKGGVSIPGGRVVQEEHESL